MNDNRIQVCAYCGFSQISEELSERCPVCNGLQDSLSRQATQNAMGPWFVRDEHHPFRPGCSYETLVRQIDKGKVTEQSIIRGPTTNQFWQLATRVPSVAHLLGVCYSCGSRVSQQEVACPLCEVLFTPCDNRLSLGLAPIRDLEVMINAQVSTMSINQQASLASVGHDRLNAGFQSTVAGDKSLKDFNADMESDFMKLAGDENYDVDVKLNLTEAIVNQISTELREQDNTVNPMALHSPIITTDRNGKVLENSGSKGIGGNNITVGAGRDNSQISSQIKWLGRWVISLVVLNILAVIMVLVIYVFWVTK